MPRFQWPLLLTLTISALWLLQNTAVPIWDGADFLLSAQNNAGKLRSGSELDFLRSVYFDRGWRPLIWSGLASPFFFIFSNQIILALAFFQTATIGVFIYFIYLLFKLHTPHNASYVASTVFLLPWLFNISRDFYPDFMLLTSSLPIIYLYLKNQVYKEKLDTVQEFILPLSVLFALGSRPVEASIYLAFLFGAIIIFQSHIFIRNILSIGTSAALFLIFIVLLPVGVKFGWWAHPNWKFEVFSIALILTICAQLFVFWRNKNLNFFSLVSFGVILSTVWYYGLANALIDWAYTTSFGDLAKQTDRRFASKSIFEIVVSLAQPVNKKLTVLLLISAIVSLAFSVLFRKSGRTDLISAVIKYRVPFLALAASTVSIILIYQQSGTGDFRRMLVPFLFLMIVCSILIGKQLNLAVSRIIFSLFFTACAVSTTAPLISYAGLDIQAVGGYRSPNFKQDVHRTFWDRLQSVAKENGDNEITNAGARISFHTLCYFDADAGCSSRDIPWIEPMALNVAARENFRYPMFHWKGDIQNVPKDQSAQAYRSSNFTHVIVDTFNDALHVSKVIGHNQATLRALSLIDDQKFLGSIKHHYSFNFEGRTFFVFVL